MKPRRPLEGKPQEMVMAFVDPGTNQLRALWQLY
jgi:hypothetical protein